MWKWKNCDKIWQKRNKKNSSFLFVLTASNLVAHEMWIKFQYCEPCEILKDEKMIEVHVKLSDSSRLGKPKTQISLNQHAWALRWWHTTVLKFNSEPSWFFMTKPFFLNIVFSSSQFLKSILHSLPPVLTFFPERPDDARTFSRLHFKRLSSCFTLTQLHFERESLFCFCVVDKKSKIYFSIKMKHFA